MATFLINTAIPTSKLSLSLYLSLFQEERTSSPALLLQDPGDMCQGELGKYFRRRSEEVERRAVTDVKLTQALLTERTHSWSGSNVQAKVPRAGSAEMVP